MNFKMILKVLGAVLKIESICMILPIICAIIYGETKETAIFLLCALICLVFGFLISIKKPKRDEMYAKEGFVSVALSWIVLSLFGTLPFVFSSAIPNFVDAFFETVSGFTTTGATILNDVEILPKSILLWRSFTHWIGGMGVLVFVMAIMPLARGGNIYLMKAESPGPSVGKLVPKMRSTALFLYGIYIVFSALELSLLLFGNIGMFDALTITFGTAGTGGFAVRNSSVAGYSSYVQYVVTVFMLVFGVDFSLYFLLFIKKQNSFFKSDEFKAYIFIVLASILVIFFNIQGSFINKEEAFRHAAFSVGSIITTTGFATIDFNLWPELSKTIIVLLMFVGACAGSTGGGIKVSRIIILFKSIVKEIRTSVHPRITIKLKMSGRTLEHETVRGVNVFMASYVVIFFSALLFISIDNFDFTTNFTAVAATINNVGPGLNAVGPMSNFSNYSMLSKIVLSFCMLVGRLEIFPLLLLFSPYTWKK